MLPNILTILRLISVPFILWLTASDQTGILVIALVLFLLAALTDWLDGYLARKQSAITAFGIVMDPVTDKVLILGILFVLSSGNPAMLPLWLVLINLFRELFVSGIRQLRAYDGRLVGASWMGKLKFGIQVGFIAGVYLYLILKSAGMRLPGGDRVVFYSLVLMTIISVVFALNFFRWHSKGMLQRRAQAEDATGRGK